MFQQFKKKVFFTSLYLFGNPPWETYITPPELIETANQMTSGRSLDIGCGTGTNIEYLAAKGWQTTGFDFSSVAVRRARQRMRRAGLPAHLLTGNMLKMRSLPLGEPFTLAYDIGCLHVLGENMRQVRQYVDGLSSWMAEGGVYLLYAHGTDQTGKQSPGEHGMEKAFLEQAFTPDFSLADYQPGKERTRKAAWYWFEYQGK